MVRVLLALAQLIALVQPSFTLLQDEGLTIPELIAYWNYPVESHDVVTEDGYILTVHRIPYGRADSNSSTTKRPVVFLQHGLLCSSSNWIVNLPEQSLGFILADNGYDVFMGNVRGNTYSRKHEHLKPNEAKFWDFSFDEHAKYDLPAMVNYALNITGEKQLSYVGHSMGTMMAFAKLSEDEEFQKKIKVFFALAPVARLRHVYGPLALMARLELTFRFTFSVFRLYNFLPSADSMTWLAKTLCPLQPHICYRIIFVTSSYGLQNFNKTRKPIYLDHTPSGTSVKNVYHFMQLAKNDKFQKYSYGFFGNLHKYGSYYPDTYDLTKIKNKIVIFYGDSDMLAHPKDVRWLCRRLPNVSEMIKIKGYNHLDFVWGLNAREEIYEKILKEMEKDKNIVTEEILT